MMRRAMRKPWYLPFKIFAARLTELNNYIPLFARSSVTNKMAPEELNKILLHCDPNDCKNQSYLQGWDSEVNSYK